MKKTINVLLVDDHSSVIEAYSNYLSHYGSINNDYKLSTSTAICCDSAVDVINSKNNKNEVIDLALIDMRLPESKDGTISCGEDLGVLLKKAFPKIKIIVITGHYEILILSGLLEKINPDAMLFKGDVEAKIIFEALTKVLNNEPYYSLTVLNLLRKKISSSVIIDHIDKQLLYELWKGTKTKDLTKVIPLSIGGIEKRKRHLRLKYNAERKDDNRLVNLILKKGFL